MTAPVPCINRMINLTGHTFYNSVSRTPQCLAFNYYILYLYYVLVPIWTTQPPEDWPRDVPYEDPNNKKDTAKHKLHVTESSKMLEFLMEKFKVLPFKPLSLSSL